MERIETTTVTDQEDQNTFNDENLIHIIPPEERPYEWARKEMESFFPNPSKFWITELDKYEEKPDSHVSVFYKGPDDPAIWRVYWKSTDSVIYDIVVNYDQLVREYPDIMGKLRERGIQDYEEFMKTSPKYVNKVIYDGFKDKDKK